MAKLYRDHIDQVGADRALEKFLMATRLCALKTPCALKLCAFVFYGRMMQCDQEQSPLEYPGNALCIHIAASMQAEQQSLNNKPEA